MHIKPAETAEQSAVYFEMDGDAIRIISKKEWPGSLFYRQVGARNERVFTHPHSLTILAFEQDSLVEFLIDAKKPSKKVKGEFLQLLKNIKDKGYFLGDDPGYPCSRAVFPVFKNGEIKGSIGICMLGQGLPESQLEKFRRTVSEFSKTASDRVSML